MLLSEIQVYINDLKVCFHHRVVEHNLSLLVAHEEDLLDHPAFVAEQGAVVNAAMTYLCNHYCQSAGSSNQPYRIARVTVGILLADAGYVVRDAHVEAILHDLLPVGSVRYQGREHGVALLRFTARADGS